MERKSFITYREEDDGVLKYYILQKEFPHNCGVISIKPNPEAIVQSTVSGYNLWVVHAGTLRGNMIAVYPSYKENLQLCYDEMANFFYNERILKDEKRYEKFKIKSNANT